MLLRIWIAPAVLIAFAMANALAQTSSPSPNADLRPEAVSAQQQDKGDKKSPGKEKKKDQQKEEKPAPLALSDLLPPEGELDIAREVRAPEMLGNFAPPGTFYTIPPQIIQEPNKIIFVKKINADGRITIVKEVIPGAKVVVPGSGGTAYLPMGTGGFKIADNNSPMPQDRVYLDFNLFNGLLGATNASQDTGIRNMNVYREALGMEKTFLAGMGSVGLVLPLNTVTLQSPITALNGTHTAIGNLSIFGRYSLYGDRVNNNWISGGLAVTAPTGPTNFAGISAPAIAPNTTVLQPFGAVLWNFGNLYIQGFSSVYTPTYASSSPTYYFNDIGVGYFLYRAPVQRWLTGVAPTFEAHVADPLNYRGAISSSNPFGAFDIVDLGAGLNVLMGPGGRSRLGLGVVTPVTGPRPFNVEALVQFRMRF